MRTIRRVLFVVVMLLALAPITVFAGTKNPYKDVTRKKVDAQSYKSIVYIKTTFNGWRALVKKGKLYPNKAMTRREFLLVLHEGWGDKVTVTMDDVRHANDIVTSKFVCNRMVELARKLNYPIKWNGNKTKLKRKDVARYIYIFATFNTALAPKK